MSGVETKSGRPARKTRAEKRRFDWSSLQPAVVRQVPEERCGESSSPGRDGDEAAAPQRAASRPLFPLRVNDLKQMAYCPRIVFFQYGMPVQRKPTFKMEHGKSIEPRFEQLERRRKLREYGLAEGTRQFQVWLRSERLGLSGRVDLVITTPTGIFPVDFKETFGPVRHNLRVQICAYALLLEDAFGMPVRVGFVYRVARGDVVPVEITDGLRAETHRLLAEIRAMIDAERMPAPTAVRARCADCEYRNYCGDVF